MTPNLEILSESEMWYCPIMKVCEYEKYSCREGKFDYLDCPNFKKIVDKERRNLLFKGRKI